MLNKNNLLLTSFVLLGYFVPLCDANFVCENKTLLLTSDWSGPGPKNEPLASYQNCFYEFTWDQDYYVLLDLRSEGAEPSLLGDRLEVKDANGNTYLVVGENSTTRYPGVYLTSGLKIHMQTEVNVKFEVTVRLYLKSTKLGPSSGKSTAIKVQPHELTHVLPLDYYVVTAETKVFMTVLSQLDDVTLRDVLIYDGSGPSAKIVGNVYDNHPFTSTGNTLTIYPGADAAFFSETAIFSRLLLDDYENVKQFSTFTTWAYGPNGSAKTVQMNANKGPAALIVGRFDSEPATCVTNVTLSDPTATMSVHLGANVIDNTLIEYSGNLSNEMPQLFPVNYTYTTFVLNKGKAVLNFNDGGAWFYVDVGREAYLISSYYGNLTYIQSLNSYDDYFTASRLVTFEMSFVKGDVADPNAYLNVSLSRDYLKGNYTIIKMSNLQKKAVSFVSSEMKPKYVSSGLSTGIILKFKVLDYNGCPTQFGFISVLLILCYMWA